MKNKLFLAFLPIALVLSSCSPAPKTIDVMKEDTTAHAEIFGEVESVDAPLLKNPARRSAADYVEPRVGVQFHSYKEGNVDYYAVRFVAAVASADVDATWTRAVSREDSNQIRTMDTYEATVAYTSINDAGNIRYPYELDNSYSRFVVYTMYKIPTEAVNYRIMAYLKLYDSTEGSTIEPVISKAVVASVNGDRVFAVNLDEVDGNYFLEGRIGGQDNKIVLDDNNTLRSNNSSFGGVTFASGDKYGMFKIDTKNKTFQFFGKTTFFATASDYVSAAEGISEYNSPKSAGMYTLFANSNNLVYIMSARTITITNLPSWIHNDDAVIFAWVWGGGSSGDWKPCTYINDYASVTLNVESDITGLQLLRFHKNTITPNRNDAYNQSGDIGINSGSDSYPSSWN